jgi:hypothetical protein
VDIKARIASHNRCMFAVQKILRFRIMSRNVKLLIHKIIIRPVVTYASETWILTKENERALNTWGKKIIIKIYCPINEGGQWRIRTHSGLQELYEEQDLVAFIKKGRLRWLCR